MGKWDKTAKLAALWRLEQMLRIRSSSASEHVPEQQVQDMDERRRS
jgi:hypothetical protein